MIDDHTIRDQAYQYFLDEIPGLLETIEQELLTLTQSDDERALRVNQLMRATHTLKGGAANVGLETIQKIAHSLEDIFKALYHPALVIDSTLQNLLFESYECLRLPVMAQLTHAIIDDDEILERAAKILAQLHTKLGDYIEDKSAFPPSAELGIDLIETFFTDVVPEQLQEISSALENLDNNESIEFFTEKIEILLSLGESLNLPGFTAIAQTALAAITYHPEQVQLIIKTTLEDLQQAQQQILTGDRTIGGNPSEILQQLGSDDHLSKKHQEAIVNSLDKQELELINSLGEMTQFYQDNSEDSSFFDSQFLEQQKLARQVDKERKKTKNSPKIRVKLEGLERLNHLVGELVINQNKKSITEQKIQISIEEFLESLQQNQQVINELNDWVDTLVMLAEQEPTQHHSFLGLCPTSSSQFDFPSLSYLASNSRIKQGALIELSKRTKVALEKVNQSTILAEKIRNLSKESHLTCKKQQRILFNMRDELIETRMSPLGNLLSRFPRLVEQLASVQNKKVELRLKGSHILVDKAIEQQLYDPLLHLIRNAFDHGIESPEIRRQLGKSETGIIEVNAYHQGSRTIIEVKDDGQGLNFERIKSRALELNLMTPEDLQSIADTKLLEFLFEPGFSTTSQVNVISGRGVGLDIVGSQLTMLKGKIAIESRQNQGTTFSLQIPLTLSIVKLMVCQSEGIVYSLLPDAIVKIILPQTKDIQLFKGRKVLHWNTETDNYIVPIRKLSELIRYQRIPQNPSTPLMTEHQDLMKPLLLLRRHQGFLGLEVDQVLGEQELVIRPLGTALNPPNYVYGCSILGDNRLSLVIDASVLINQTDHQTLDSPQLSPLCAPLIQDGFSQTHPIDQNLLSNLSSSNSQILLVVDDSISLRQTVTLMLQKFGYNVLQAGDGIEALEELERLKKVNLVICDLDMPRMNGLEFLKTVRQHPELSNIPIIMLTSHSSDPYRQLAKQLGVTAYLTKPCDQQNLLKTILDLINNS